MRELVVDLDFQILSCRQPFPPEILQPFFEQQNRELEPAHLPSNFAHQKQELPHLQVLLVNFAQGYRLAAEKKPYLLQPTLHQSFTDEVQSVNNKTPLFAHADCGDIVVVVNGHVMEVKAQEVALVACHFHFLFEDVHDLPFPCQKLLHCLKARQVLRQLEYSAPASVVCYFLGQPELKLPHRRFGLHIGVYFLGDGVMGADGGFLQLGSHGSMPPCQLFTLECCKRFNLLSQPGQGAFFFCFLFYLAHNYNDLCGKIITFLRTRKLSHFSALVNYHISPHQLIMIGILGFLLPAQTVGTAIRVLSVLREGSSLISPKGANYFSSICFHCRFIWKTLLYFFVCTFLTIARIHDVSQCTVYSDCSLKGSSQILLPELPSFFMKSPPRISPSNSSKKQVYLYPVGFPFTRCSPVHSCLKFQQVCGSRSFHSYIFILPTFFLPISTSKNTTVLLDFILQQSRHYNKRQGQTEELFMDFLLNPNPLPFGLSRKSNQFQYYEWQYKQQLLDERKQDKILAQMLAEIEQKQKQQASKKWVKKKRTHHVGSFYDYNMEWKNRIDQKVKLEQLIQEEVREREDEEQMIPPEKTHERKETSLFYKGPVQGWEQHFQEYLLRKTNKGCLQDEGVTFHPQINERSKKIAERITGKVEDRLLKFGQMQKMRQMEHQYVKTPIHNQSNYSFSQKGNQRFSDSSTFLDPFNRLHKYGEELSKRKKQEEMKQVHSFQPKTNKLPEQIQDRIMKRRKPLYYIKNSLSQNNSLQDEINFKKHAKSNKENFEQFMMRNQVLLNKRSEMNNMKNELVREKEKKQRIHCTFEPKLNQHSMRISQTIRNTNRQFQEKMLANISGEFLSEPREFRNEVRDQINLSKVTVIENRYDTSFEDSDSLSRLGESSAKQTKRKYFLAEEQMRTEDIVVHEEEEEEEIEVHHSRNTSENMTENMMGVSKHRLAGTQEMSGELQDSIEKMKDQAWEAQLSQVEHHLESMMARAVKYE